MVKKEKKSFNVFKKGILGLSLAGVMIASSLALTGCSLEAKETVSPTWHSGTSYTEVKGVDGDFFFDTDDCNIYKKTDNDWILISNIKGLNGEDGIAPTISEDGYWVVNGEKTNFKAEVEETENVWKGKKAVFVGDSITYGLTTYGATEGNRYWELLNNKFEFGEVVDMGVGGSAISSKNDKVSKYVPLIDRYLDIPNADLIQIFMGTNDYGFNTPLGTIDDTTDVSFYGALNVIIPKLQAKYPNAKIVFVTPLHRYGQHNLTYDYMKNTAGYVLEDYVNAIKDVCERYSISVIDLFCNSGINPSLQSVRVTYMPDGLHPNNNGHKLIAEIMSKQLELYTPNDINAELEKTTNEISLVVGSSYYPSSTESKRLSSAYNVYLEAGQTVSLVDKTTFKFFLYAQATETPKQVREADRRVVMSGWGIEPFTVSYTGWYGVTMCNVDNSDFDETTISNQTLADYIIIQ